MTARCPNEADYTVRQLHSIGINFENLKQKLKFDNFTNEMKKPLYQQGILFGTPFNKKSQVLFEFLSENNFRPECIKLSHLEDISKACCERGILFYGVRFGGADEYVKAFNPQIADIQWSLFPVLISDKQAEKILISAKKYEK